MANEISANNIKQSYDLAENKIFPKTTINGIVFDSDDSVVGSSAIIKSLVNENLLVKNIEVNTDSSTGGYIHLKTNNGDASGVSVLELKLGHKGVDDTSTNKIYINEANDPNTDVTAFFNKMEVSSAEYVGKVGTATINSGDMNVKIDKTGVAVNNGSVTAGTYYVGKGGNIGSSDEGLIELSSKKIKAGYIGNLKFADNTIELNSGRSGISIAGKMGIINMCDDASEGYISASLKKLDITSIDAIGLNAPNTVIYNEKGNVELALSNNMHGDKCAKVHFDASPNVTLKFQIDYDDKEQHVQFSEYPIQYEHRLREEDSYLRLNAYTTNNNTTTISSYLHIGADSIHMVAPSITGTVNGVNDVLMGVPIGSVVKWIVDSSIPEGWIKNDSVGTYVGIVLVDKSKNPYTYTLCKASIREIRPGFVTPGGGVGQNGIYAYCYYTDSSTVVGLEESEFNEYIKIPSGYIICSGNQNIGGVEITEQNRRNYEFYHVFSFNETGKRLSSMFKFKYYDASNFSPIIYTDASNGFLCKFGRTNIDDKSLSLHWYFQGTNKYILTLIMSDYTKDSSGNIEIHDIQYAGSEEEIKSAKAIFGDYIMNWDNYEIMKCQ